MALKIVRIPGAGASVKAHVAGDFAAIVMGSGAYASGRYRIARISSGKVLCVLRGVKVAKAEIERLSKEAQA